MHEDNQQTRIRQWANALRALADDGLQHSPDVFSHERYEQMAQIAGDMLHADELTKRTALFTQAQPTPPTPKTGVRGAVFDHQGRILLVRERDDHLWTLPGGYCDVGVPPARMIEREIREESGYEARAVRLFALHHEIGQDGVSTFYTAYFICQLVNEASRTPSQPDTIDGNPETEKVAFFAQDALPPLSAHRHAVWGVAQAFEHYHDAQRPAYFD